MRKKSFFSQEKNIRIRMLNIFQIKRYLTVELFSTILDNPTSRLKIKPPIFYDYIFLLLREILLRNANQLNENNF